MATRRIKLASRSHSSTALLLLEVRLDEEEIHTVV
jgi:hypothetical protein